MLVSVSANETARIWNAGSGECLQILKGHLDFVISASFSPDSTQLVTASWDKTIKQRDVSKSTGTRMAKRPSDSVNFVAFKGHRSMINSLAFSHNSEWLASGSWDGAIKIWDARSGECLQASLTEGPCFNISFDTTGSRLLCVDVAIDITVPRRSTTSDMVPSGTPY